MEKKQKVIPVICALLFLILFMQQYLQSRTINQLLGESEYGDRYHQNTNRKILEELQSIKTELLKDIDREIKEELQGIKTELIQVSYNLQRNSDLSALTAANQAVERTKDLPLLISPAFEEGRLVLNIGNEIKRNDTLFGVSLRKGQAITNHEVRTALSYNGEIPHPLADQFILVLYRSGTFERNGQRLSGVHPIKRWSTTLTPIDSDK